MKSRILAITLLCICLVKGDLLSSAFSTINTLSSPNSQEGFLTSGVLPYIFDAFATTKISEFPVKNGKFKNIQIKLIPPSSWESVKTEVQFDSLFLKIGGIGVKIGADFELIFGTKPSTGHVDVDITDLAVHIKMSNKPKNTQNDRQIGSDITLDTSKTHVNAQVTSEGNVQEIREYLYEMVKKEAAKSSWVPSWAQGMFWKIQSNEHFDANKLKGIYFF